MALFLLGHWWSSFEVAVFERLVELYKKVVVYLLRMHKLGIPSVEQRIFNSFLDISLRFLELLHAVRTKAKRKTKSKRNSNFYKSLLTIVLLLQVNERAGHIIEYNHFYIHELDELVDIRNDYITWFQRQMFPSVSVPVIIGCVSNNFVLYAGVYIYDL